MADFSGWSGYQPMSNATNQLWVDWMTTRVILNGQPGWYVHLVLKANRTPGYTTWGNGSVWVQAGSTKIENAQDISIVSTETTYMERDIFVPGISGEDGAVACNGGIWIDGVSSGQVDFVVPLKKNGSNIWFNANGGSGAPASQIKLYGAHLTLSSQVPTRNGYRFLGWSESQNGSVQYHPGGTFYNDNHTTLFAVWERLMYTVTFDATTNGGQGNTTRYIPTGEAMGVLPVATKNGYEFLGWFLSKNGGAQMIPTTVPSGNITVYAIFKAKSSVHVRVAGTQRKGTPYVLVSGTYRKGYAYQRTGGQWRKGISS